MTFAPTVSSTASLIADPTRWAMLATLLDGRALPAGELAHAAGVTAQTASTHLSKLREGGLIALERQGRHRYYRLAGTHVAEAIERLASIEPEAPRQRPRKRGYSPALQFARRCYDHLAGQLGVAVTRSLLEKDLLAPADEKRFEVTPAGVQWFRDLGLDVTNLGLPPSGLARRCLDASERFHHLGGPLGVALLDNFCSRGWLSHSRTSRVVRVTPAGNAALRRYLRLDDQSLRASQQ